MNIHTFNNPKFVSTVIAFIVGIIANFIFTKTGIEIPEEVKYAFVAIILTLIGRYTRIWNTDEKSYKISPYSKTLNDNQQ